MPSLIPLALAATSLSLAEPLPLFSYPDTETARQHWREQFGGHGPVRVEQLDGSSCLVLQATFTADKERACWDWFGETDLSATGRIAFDVSATNPSVVSTVGIYFGTPTGWYPRYFGLTERWARQVLRPDSFGVEGEPGGWDKVDRFRLSFWSAGPGEVTIRLRNMEALPADPGENFVKNGSFEIPGLGVPYGWGSGHWGIGQLPWAADMDLWRARFRVDDSAAQHGTHSLLIHNTDALPLLKAQSVWFTPPKSAETLVLSASLKSDRAGLPVTLTCGERSGNVEAGTEWSQASVGGIEPGERIIVTIAPQAPGKLWIDAVQLQALSEPTQEFHPAFADESLATREAQVDWSPPRRTPEVVAGRVGRGPIAAAKATIDEHGRLLLDGEPYIQHSLGLEFISDLDILNFVADSGFRDVCVQIKPGITTEELQGIFDRCAQVGLRIVPWLDGRIPLEQYRQHIEALHDHPALLVWYVYDEPSGERFAEADARYRLAKELDPSRPALINYLSSKLEDHTGDIYSTDVYPIPHSSPAAAIDAVRRMQAAAARERKPVWMWLQGTGYAYWMDREPSPRELSCMVYGSLIEGARGLYYFAQIPRTRECFAEMRALLVEVDALTPALTSLDEAPPVTCDSPNVLCRAYAHEGSTWVLAANTQPTALKAILGIDGADGQVEVLLEGRTLQAQEGAWTDSFGPYERHVYRLAVGNT